MHHQTTSHTIYRVTDPGRLAELEQAIGASVLEACRISGCGVRPSTFRVWDTAGRCYEMPKSGPDAMVATRAAQFDRVKKAHV